MFWGIAASRFSFGMVPSRIFRQWSHPRGVMKYTLRVFFSLPLTRPFRQTTRPSSTRFDTSMDAWDRDMPRASAMPFCVSSLGMTKSSVSDMCR